MTMSSGGLRSRVWKRFLSAPDPSLVSELYEPGLSVAVRYDRCCSYFSSSVLAAAARGFGPLIERLLALGEAGPHPAIRLLVNEELEDADVRAMLETGDTSALEALLEGRLGAATTALEQRRLEMLSFLVARGLLEVRVGIMANSLGMLHAKFGTITDASGDALTFRGSGNETEAGLRGNYEQLELSTSWEDREAFMHYQATFAELWEGRNPDVLVVPLPELVRERLAAAAPASPPPHEGPLHRAMLEESMRWQFIAEAPYLVGQAGLDACDATAFVSPWPHQRQVVQETVAAWPDGRLLCDEVGMGKTIEAILILRRLLHGRGVRRVLFLLPAGLMSQWQDELREKGGLLVPRFEANRLVWPGGRATQVAGLQEALSEPLVIVSRELARLDQHRATLLDAQSWDLVLVDETHAARRARQEENEFNSATLLLALLRDLQLKQRATSFLLLSATPMQTHPWEPFDLLQVLGEGGEWLADFGGIRTYYGAAGTLVRGAPCDPGPAAKAAQMAARDGRYAPPPSPPGLAASDEPELARELQWAFSAERPPLGEWLRAEAPLARRMHRNTRRTLRQYHEQGLIAQPPPRREVEDRRFDYANEDERGVYDAVGRYIDRRFDELERERAGKGFVMTIYRRRASSSPQALRRSLERRRDGLERAIAEAPTESELASEEVSSFELEDAGEEFVDERGSAIRVARGLPEDPVIAAAELDDVTALLGRLAALSGIDTKRDVFWEALQEVVADGRPALVFTEAADTMEYLRDWLLGWFGVGLGTYSGAGGERWTGTRWEHLSKQAVTQLLNAGDLRVIICTDAASEGLNLQAAAALINYDLPWNPSRVEQRIGRIDRIGQQYGEVRVVNLLLRDSIDDRVYQVLEERCGMFRDYIGEMQPVLAEARRLLLRGRGSLDELARSADRAGHDDLGPAVYRPVTVAALPAAAPAVTASELMAALSGTRASEFRTEVLQDGSLRLTSRQGASTLWSCSSVALATKGELQPLTPAASIVTQLAARFRVEGPLLPLIVETRSAAAFRVSAAAWVHHDGVAELVESLSQLDALISAWDELTPSREHVSAARAEARELAASAVSAASEQAAQGSEGARLAQIAAARGRLTRELCRYFLVRQPTPDAPSADALNQSMYREMERPGLPARRLLGAYGRLGGYPEWDRLMVEELFAVVANMNEARRNSVLTLTGVDAALADPRWQAGVSIA